MATLSEKVVLALRNFPPLSLPPENDGRVVEVFDAEDVEEIYRSGGGRGVGGGGGKKKRTELPQVPVLPPCPGWRASIPTAGRA